jgi:MOSC domain-containing protein YiiM
MPHLVSVNVGRPAPFRVGRRVIRSAFVKAPVAGPVAVRMTHLEGDEQGDRVHHGGREQAVYAYASEDTAWWSAELGRALAPAAFGENLTLAGLDVSGARIGERWRIGSAELRVTAPRVPCAKLAASIGDQGFVRRFTHALRPGAYLAVEREGVLEAGDAVEVMHRPSHAVTSALVLEVLVLAPARIAELEPAREDMLPGLAEWVQERAGAPFASGEPGVAAAP